MRNPAVVATLLLAMATPFFIGCGADQPTASNTASTDSTQYDHTSLRYGLGAGKINIGTDPKGKFHTIYVFDTVVVHDTIVVIDTVPPPLTGDWLEFSAYEAAIGFVKENYPARATDRFSSMSTYCDYNPNTPAGRAGFLFIDEGNGVYTAQGYTFEHVFGADGFEWGAAQNQPTENTYWYRCRMQLREGNKWTLLAITLDRAGDYIRDTRHD